MKQLAIIISFFSINAFSKLHNIPGNRDSIITIEENSYYFNFGFNCRGNSSDNFNLYMNKPSLNISNTQNINVLSVTDFGTIIVKRNLNQEACILFQNKDSGPNCYSPVISGTKSRVKINAMASNIKDEDNYDVYSITLKIYTINESGIESPEPIRTFNSTCRPKIDRKL